MHQLPCAVDRRAVCVGVGAWTTQLARARARRRGVERPGAERHHGGARRRAYVRVRADDCRASAHWSAEIGTRGVRTNGARIVPLLSEPGTELARATPFRGAREGAVQAFETCRSTQ